MVEESLNDLYAFLIIYREGSFTRAAARLGVSQSALSHTMRNLESRRGIQLLNRTTRSVSPTAAGMRLLETLAPSFDEIRMELAKLKDLSDKPAGTIRISTAEHAVEAVIWPKLVPFLKEHPDINVEIAYDYGMTDIVAQGLDAGVRLGDQLQKDMIAARIGPNMRMAVVGSPGYFARYPKPSSPHDLTDHSCVNLRLPTYGDLLPWDFEKEGQVLNVRVKGQLVFSSILPALKAALAGSGLSFVPSDMADPYIAEGRLINVLKDWCQPFSGYHLYYPSRHQHSAAFELLVEALRYRE